MRSKYGSRVYVHFHYSEIYFYVGEKVRVDGDAVVNHHNDNHRMLYECIMDGVKGTIIDTDLYWSDQQ